MANEIKPQDQESVKKLTELKEAFASITKDIKEIGEKLDSFKSADGAAGDKKAPAPTADDMQNMQRNMMDVMGRIADNLHNSLSYAHERISKAQDAQYQHTSNGHLPPLSGGQMKKALAKLGLDDDYSVSTPTISCKASRHGMLIEASYQGKN